MNEHYVNQEQDPPDNMIDVGVFDTKRLMELKKWIDNRNSTRILENSREFNPNRRT